MNKKILNVVLVIVLTVTFLLATPGKTQAANYKKAYKKALTTTISGGIYSRYAYINIKGFSKPVMMVIRDDWNSDFGTSPKASFYYYKNRKVKKIGSISLSSGERDDWKLKRKGKKYILYYKIGSDANYYVLKNKKGKVKADLYVYESARFGESARYYVNSKVISKSKFMKAVKGTKKVKIKEHFAEREY